MINTERIRKVARNVAEKYDLGVPADLMKIISDCCEYNETDGIDGIDGYTDLSTIPPTIYINSKRDYQKRKRFTIAHELGHIFIPWHNGASTYTEPESKTGTLINKNELEADTFASELLMPEKWLKEKAAEYKDRDLKDLIAYIIKEADVSFVACVKAIQQIWHGCHILRYAIPDWEQWQVMLVGVDRLTTFYKSDETEKRKLWLDLCSVRNEWFQYGAYIVEHYELLDIEQDLLSAYEKSNGNLEAFLNLISDNRPILAVPFIRYIIKTLPEEYFAIVKLDGYDVTLVYNGKSGLRCGYNYNNYETYVQRIKASYADREKGEIFLGEGCCMYWVKMRREIPPVCTYSEPNELLSEIIYEVCGDDTEVVWRKINGIIGGSNNIKDKGTKEDFYDLLYNRLYSHEMLRTIVEHPRFNEYLINKIQQLLIK